jgi:hypothetical protein
VFQLSTCSQLQLLHPDGTPVSVGDKPCALLALLAAAGPVGLARKTCRELLWEGATDANGSNSLRQSVFRLRRALGPTAIDDVGGRLVLRLPITIDLTEVETLLHAGQLTAALDQLPGPVALALDVAGPQLRAWVTDRRGVIERRIVHLLRERWHETREGPAPVLIEPALRHARAVLRDQEELLWIQLELDAILGSLPAFHRHVDELAAVHERTPPREDLGAVRRRLETLRSQAERADRARRVAPASVLHAAPLTALERAWKSSRSAPHPVVWINGDGGAGRTWLLREFARRVGADGGRTGQVVADHSALGVPGAFLRDLAVTLKGMRGAAGLDPAYAETLHRIQHGVLDPPADAVEAVLDLITAICDEGPLVLLIDDGHRYDGAALPRLLRRLAGRTRAGLLMVVAVRSGSVEMPDGAMPLPLPPIDRDGVRVLLNGMARLPRTDWVDALIDALLTVSAGSPGRAVAEIVRLHADGALTVADDRWTLRAPLSEVLSRLRAAAAA